MREVVACVWPTQCVGCGSWDVVLCADCEQQFTCGTREWSALSVSLGGEAVPFIALGEYEGVRRRVMLSAKHHRFVDFSQLLQRAGESIAESLICVGMMLFLAEPSIRELWVVPAPASWTRRLWGRSVTIPVACGLARVCASHMSVPVRVVEAVSLRVGTFSQAGRSSQRRRQGRRGVMRLRFPVPQGVKVIVVDDVVASGATVEELLRCLGKVVSMVACVAWSTGKVSR
ncbi:phosphoribosyltransferase family protein [Schaalia sp. lx-260]|uniref:phosphoribosyltransferase family protein n=1 Tax=Schaalia sp. lx-260 TaxID=2899082 RepID=UPI001E439324|nr:phosphoribosyltransferase family protein [Schaalia sp. lx-260]MCD4549723.1 competence protein ComF [Schaalia sp. lx-260]